MNKLKLLRNDDIHFQLVMVEGVVGGDENGSFQNQPEGAATAKLQSLHLEQQKQVIPSKRFSHPGLLER